MNDGLLDVMVRLLHEQLSRKKISQADFARRLGVSQKHVSQVLTGKSGTTVAQLEYWAFTLGMEWSIDLVPRVTGGTRSLDSRPLPM